MSYWTKEEIESVLAQLEERDCLFSKYRFRKLGNDLSLLGKGAFAYVYEMENLKGLPFAMKVIGFGDKRLDPSSFRELVRVQKYLSSYQSNVVKVYDFRELWVWLSDDGHVEKVTDLADNREIIAMEGKGSDETNRLCLQFILTERLEPVIRKGAFGKITLFPKKLAAFDEGEIVKLALDIGGALGEAHKNKILHRDVKLENIFYSTNEGRYKLGDFGIARVTLDGMAETANFTKGYGAPEVVDIKGKYDNTADIYSFGIVLYVLLNRLKFPGSDGYYVCPEVQYSKGVILPAPETTPVDLWEIVRKMCSYESAQRYESMNEILERLKDIYGTEKAKYRNRHVKAYWAVGLLCLASGFLLGKMMERQWQWVTVFLLSNGFLLLAKNVVQKAGFLLGVRKRLNGNAFRVEETLSEREEGQAEITIMQFEKISFVFYANLVMCGFCLNVLPSFNEENPVGLWLKWGLLGKIGEIHIGWAGLAGMFFWIFWTLRENALIRLDQ